jgi:uncharacterized protein DUF6785
MKNGLTTRSIAIGLIFVFANVYWVTAGNEIWGTVQLTIASLFFNAVFSLFVLSLLNLLIQRVSPKWALSQAEMLVIYVMTVMTSTLSGHTMMSFLMGGLTHGFWFASAENEWSELFLEHIPTWFTVSDRGLLRGYFRGESSFYLSQNMRAWLVPMLVWSSVIIVLWFVLICINVLIKKQ